MSVTVLVCGSGPSTRSVDTLFTLSLASLVTSPKPAASGNDIPATTTPATTHNASNRATNRRTRRNAFIGAAREEREGGRDWF